MESYHYVGLDVHKKMISYCVRRMDGTIVGEGEIRATRADLSAWVSTVQSPWAGAMEATLFTGWVYDFLLPHASDLKVGHSYMLRAICAAKKKSDRIDARKLADALRCDWFPACHIPPKQRNKHLQTMLVEAAKLAPRWNPPLAKLYEKERDRGANCNRATLGKPSVKKGKSLSL